MREMKIGAITVGQSPRTDVTGDILPIFQGKIELIERGALGGLTREDIARFAPRGDDYVLVSRLCDGSSVTFGESYIVDRLQNGIPVEANTLAELRRIAAELGIEGV